MAIKNILQNIAEDIGVELSVPNIALTSDAHIGPIAHLMNQTGQELAARAEWSRALATWLVNPGLSQASLPMDYFRMPEKGAIILPNSARGPVRLIASPSTWQFIKAQRSDQTYAHISGGKLLFSPDTGPNGAEVTYIKKGWLTDGKDYVIDNEQEPIFPENLLSLGVAWRWNRRSGLPYDDLVAEYEAAFVAALTADRGLS